MLYYLFDYLNGLDFPGAGMFQYISFRSSMALITSLLVSMLIGKRIIQYLQKKQIGETIRNLDLEGQMQKKGTPTMGGLIIIGSILVPVLLFVKLDNFYVLLMIFSTLWLGIIGFLDDYIKVFKKNKEGLRGRTKLIGQVILGLIVGLSLLLNDGATIREKKPVEEYAQIENIEYQEVRAMNIWSEDIKSTKTTIPFLKNNEFDYANLVSFLGEKSKAWGWVVFVLIAIFIITAVSNGANLTDGLDGLATGTSAITGITLGVLAYVSGNLIWADYLNIMYIPHTGELVVFISAFIGATVGFLWYNSYPAQVFMGDTGSLTLGGIIAVFAIIIHKELLIPILCGIFLVENLSVVVQVAWFKHTRKKYGEGRRVFRMAPLHHHYQKKGYPEAKIVTRFWIVAIMLAILSIVTLKIR
ncbi:MAG: phospho-N-acetylmuramoyl-pentapeptide-transferase [Bacteroidota bacterium]|nr:phospho-N-acetylmuramoyl-pentapeptide-transferase [Bacteroidota bacterium]